MQLPSKSKGQNAILAELRREIVATGPISFARFMEQALYHPQAGYYSSGRARLGRTGDYFTSVSVGALFGRMLAAQFLEARELLGRPENFTVVEQGSGSGDLARDVRTAASDLRVVEIERARGGSLAEVEPFCGVHFSNELIDSFPVHLVKWTGTEWLERHLDSGFAWIDLPITNPSLLERVRQIPLPLPAGYETEVNLAALDWIALLAQKLTRGFVIACDYGFARDDYYAPHRTRGTLQCYKNHRVIADPLSEIGEADLTAHVEWTSLVEHALWHGFKFVGFADQHHFLTGLLTEGLAADAANSRALQTLLHPGFLGMKFQFLVLAKDVTPEIRLSGLRFARDPVHALGLDAK